MRFYKFPFLMHCVCDNIEFEMRAKLTKRFLVVYINRVALIGLLLYNFKKLCHFNIFVK